MPAMTELAQVGKRQEIADQIFNIQPEATPMLSILKKSGMPKQMLSTWQSEVYPDIASTGVVDGTPVTTYERIDRYLLRGYAHYFRRPWAVTTLANLTEIAGAGRNEAGHQLKAAMLLIKRMIEQQILSGDDTQADSGSVGYEMRGMGSWLDDSAQAVLPVDAAIRPATANIYTGALASYTENSFRTQLESGYTEKKSALNLVGVVDKDLKAIVDDWTNVYPVASSTSQPRTVYRVEGNETYSNIVSQIKFSTGEASLMLSEFIDRDTSDGTADTIPGNGYFIDPKMWDLCYMSKPANTNLPPDGSGRRGYIDAVAIARCFNPLGQLKVDCAS